MAKEIGDIEDVPDIAKRKLSKEMQAIVGVEITSRGKCIQKIWEHIRNNKLQDPKNPAMIIPDEKLAVIFGNEPFRIQKIPSKILRKHLFFYSIKPREVPK